MRLLLGGWSPAVVSLLVAVELLGCPRVAAPQSADATAARPVLRTASNGEVALAGHAASRLESAQHLLFDARYADAITAFSTALGHDDARGTDTLTTWAHHGIAVAQAFAGHTAAARAHYDAVLRAPSPPTFALADSIEAAVLTGRHSTATVLLDRFGQTHRSVLAQQYMRSFRALDFLFRGNCTAALSEVKLAPDAGRPLPQAVRGLCAARAGRHAEAITLRDSVLTHPLADPHSWPMIVARGVAMRIR